jgi:pyridoxal phosphate enzyme (YggS family)
MSIAAKYKEIKDEMQRAALHFYCVDAAVDIPRYTGLYNEEHSKPQSSGSRDPNFQNSEFKSPEIIAVSKRQPEARIIEALDAGLRHFGENKLQEAQERWQDRRAAYPDLTLHMIGPIQSNKAAAVVELFDVIHSIDRKKIADALKAEMDKQGRNLPCFIQVNIGEEPQKSGIMPADLAD